MAFVHFLLKNENLNGRDIGLARVSRKTNVEYRNAVKNKRGSLFFVFLEKIATLRRLGNKTIFWQNFLKNGKKSLIFGIFFTFLERTRIDFHFEKGSKNAISFSTCW